MSNKIKFEFDARKAASNLSKHGVSFLEAETVFDDPLSSALPDDQHSWDEPRMTIVGKSVIGRHLFVVYTETGLTIRLIGARLATARERRQYEQAP